MAHSVSARRIWPYVFGLVVLASLGWGANRVWSQWSAKVHHVSAPPSAAVPTPSPTPSLPQIIQQVLPSLVQIQTTTANGDKMGSGFVYDRFGDIATNAHVVQGALGITVTTSNGRTFDANVLGQSAAQDVASLRVQALSSVNPLDLGDSSKLQLGDAVIALGSPLGLKDTVTSGLISGLHRNFQIQTVQYHDMLQISAPIAPGNSGGPLVEQSSQRVVGIDTAGAMQSSGNVGFAIPINQVKSLLLKWGGAPRNPSPSKAPPSLAQQSVNLLKTFYRDINQKQYAQAYRLMGADWQRQESFKAFVAGFQSTLSDRISQIVTNPIGNGEMEVSFTLTARTRTAGASSLITTYHLNYLFGPENGRLHILHGTARVLGKSKTAGGTL